MSRNALGALLIVQLVVIAAFYVVDYLASRSSAPFLSFDKTKIAAVRLFETDRELGLSKQTAETGEETWVLEDGLPADNVKVSGLMDKLLEAGKADWPVAVTLTSVDRFELSDENYHKRIALEDSDGDLLVDLYLGTTASFGQTHARLAGGLNVYAVKFADYEAVPEHKDWLRKTLIQADGAVSLVHRLEADKPVWTLEQSEFGWRSDSITSLNVAEANAVANRLKQLRVLARAEATNTDPTLRFYLEDAKGGYHLDFFDQGEDESLIVKSSRLDAYFEASSHLRDALDVDITDLTEETSDDS